MVWNSIALMTAIDAVVLVAAVALAFVVFRSRRPRAARSGVAGPALIVAGVGLTAFFHGLDLTTMWVLPSFVGSSAAMEWMTQLHPNARWFVTLLSTFAIVSGFLLLRRAEDRVTAEGDVTLQTLRESEARFRAIAQNSSDLVTEIRPDGTYVFASASHGTTLGYDPEELRNVKSVVRLHEDDWPRVRDQCNELFHTGDPFVSEHRLRRKDGSYGWFEMVANAYVTADGERRLIGTSREISARKAAQEALRKAEMQLAHAQKMEAIGRLAGGVAHDFNNHLTVISLYAEELAKELSGGRANEALVEILSATNQAATLTGRLLAFSRQRPFQPKVVDCNQVLAGLENMLTRLIGADVDPRIQLGPAVGSVKVDPGQLEQVIMNLAVNARDAMPGGGELLISTRAVELSEGGTGHPSSGLEPGPYVCISVTDTGCGMDAETVARIFEPFFTTKPEGQGTGLGLSTAYGVVRQNGGAIAVESEPGVGSTFRIYLPRSEERPEDAELGAAPPAGAAQHATILLVDDDGAVRQPLGAALARAGYRVIEASDPTAALAAWREDPKIDLLLTDVVMPGMSGMRLYQSLVEDGCSCRVIFMSGYAKSIGGDAEPLPDAPFLQKPFGSRELLDAVRGSLARA